MSRQTSNTPSCHLDIQFLLWQRLPVAKAAPRRLGVLLNSRGAKFPDNQHVKMSRQTWIQHPATLTSSSCSKKVTPCGKGCPPQTGHWFSPAVPHTGSSARHPRQNIWWETLYRCPYLCRYFFLRCFFAITLTVYFALRKIVVSGAIESGD